MEDIGSFPDDAEFSLPEGKTKPAAVSVGQGRARQWDPGSDVPCFVREFDRISDRRPYHLHVQPSAHDTSRSSIETLHRTNDLRFGAATPAQPVVDGLASIVFVGFQLQRGDETAIEEL